MKNKNTYIIGAILIGVFFLFAASLLNTPVLATESCSDLRRLNAPELEACLIESKDRESAYKTQYQESANNAALFREQLSVEEMQMKNLNGQAEAERIKQRIILRLQSSFQQPAQSEE